MGQWDQHFKSKVFFIPANKYLVSLIMRETLFIKKNKARWESLDASRSNDPDELCNSYNQVVDDLAYAQTFYPRSHTRRYLNERAVNFYNRIYSKRKEKITAVFRFFDTELPLAIRYSHKQLLYAFLFFMVFALIGVLSAAHERDFLEVILGKGYVDMTIDNIQKGDPFGVYKDTSYLLMFFRIAMNNIFIAIVMVYATGLGLGIFTVYNLMTNGIMLGAFQYFFFAHGLGWQSILVIWIHGVLEISALVIAGGAGLALGNSLLFPGTLKRVDSLKRAAARSAPILFITVMMLLAAAWLESYVTHLSSNYFDNAHSGFELPWWGSCLILLACLYFVVWYFIVYPPRVEKRIAKGIS
jgi:uncharacterized membrane protein SpoIIM required for sporulation